MAAKNSPVYTSTFVLLLVFELPPPLIIQDKIILCWEIKTPVDRINKF